MPYQPDHPPNYGYGYERGRMPGPNPAAQAQAYPRQTPYAPQSSTGGGFVQQQQQQHPTVYQPALSPTDIHAAYFNPSFGNLAQYPSTYHQPPPQYLPNQYGIPQPGRSSSQPSQSHVDEREHSPDPLHRYQPPPVPHGRPPASTPQQFPASQPSWQQIPTPPEQQWPSSMPPPRSAFHSQPVHRYDVDQSSHVIAQAPPQYRASHVARSSPVTQQERTFTPPGPSPSIPYSQFSNANPRPSNTMPPPSSDPESIQYKVAQVLIRAYPNHPHSQMLMAPTPKRRKSSDSRAASVNQAPPKPENSRTPQVRIQNAVAAVPNQTKPGHPRIPQVQIPNTIAAVSSKAKPSLPAPTSAAVDYQAVLLSLSDEYINAAFNMSATMLSESASDDDVEQYHALMAAGLGCLDSVLQNYRIPDQRKEARIRLRYATLLHEETLNSLQAEEVLSKGITICERARLLDLKYAMHHLLARVWFKGGKVKAALKAIDKLVDEAEKLEIWHWMYAFRFLRVTLGLQIENTHAENAAMIKHLTAGAEHARDNHHVAAHMTICLLEALVHLRSRTPESVDMAQRALATARMHQLMPEMKGKPQILTLLDCIDLACCLGQAGPEQALSSKMQTMQKHLEASAKQPGWRKDGGCLVALTETQFPAKDTITADTGGVMEITPNGRCALRFTWLTKTDIFSLAYLLSGLTSLQTSTSGPSKTQGYLAEGLKNAQIKSDAVPQSLSSAQMRQKALILMRINLRAYGVFAYCGASEWEKALRGVANIRLTFRDFDVIPSPEMNALVTYLEAVGKHGLGDLAGALDLYNSSQLEIDWTDVDRSSSPRVDPIRVLAAIHRVLIERQLFAENKAATETEDSEELLSRLEALCLTTINDNGNQYGSKAVEAAYYILKATEPPPSEEGVIIRTKQHLHCAAQASQKAVNSHLQTVVVNCMTEFYFTNIVGDQAEKSAAAGRTLAKKTYNKLWTAVACEMYGATLEKCGKLGEADAMRVEAETTLQGLPESLKMALARDQVSGTQQ